MLETIDGSEGRRRLIFIGDIHGCYDELTKLLDRVAPAADDVVVSVGDIVRKGPEVVRCLELWRERGYRAVLGNNEERLLRSGFLARFFGPDAAVLRRRDLIRYIRSWPVVIDFPHEAITAVHGGFLPGMRIDLPAVAAASYDLVRMRYVRKTDDGWKRVSKGHERKGDVPWTDVWDGDRTVVYGHTPMKEARVEANSVGIDTGCVYGRKLTAAVWSNGTWELVSVKAKQAYSD